MVQTRNDLFRNRQQLLNSEDAFLSSDSDSSDPDIRNEDISTEETPVPQQVVTMSIASLTNPYARYIDLYSSTGTKLFQKATEGASKDKKFDLSGAFSKTIRQEA